MAITPDDRNRMDAAQEEVLRALNDVRARFGGRSAEAEHFTQESDTWRRVDPAGHRAWAEQGLTLDGQPYTPGDWAREGLAMAEQMGELLAQPSNPATFHAVIDPEVAQQEATRSSRIRAGVTVGLTVLPTLATLAYFAFRRRRS
jgi:hypothetical protein